MKKSIVIFVLGLLFVLQAFATEEDRLMVIYAKLQSVAPDSLLAVQLEMHYRKIEYGIASAVKDKAVRVNPELTRTLSDKALAAVLAHELGHIYHKHSAQRASLFSMEKEKASRLLHAQEFAADAFAAKLLNQTKFGAEGLNEFLALLVDIESFSHPSPSMREFKLFYNSKANRG